MSDFETFALDPANAAAAAAARAVADSTGVPFAPLVVIGPRGSGKTELLLAIAERVKAHHPGDLLELLDPDALAERHRSALLAGRGEEYRARLLGATLLLLDDLQNLARHRDCQGFVADLLDARRTAGREMVVAAATPIDGLEGIDPRLIRRMREGTTVELTLPRAEARVSILRRRLATTGGSLPDDVVRALAEAEFASLRDYTGGLSRLRAFQEASPVPLTPRDALLLIGVPAAVAATVATGAAAEPADEFGAFLNEVTAGLSEQVDRWRQRIGEAVHRWGDEGLRTRRLEALLDQEAADDPAPALSAYQADALEILALAKEAAAISPDLAGAEIFRDPDQVAAARALVEQARTAAPLSAPLPHYRWADLVEGPASRLVLRAGRDIINEPGRRYSPLVVIGGAGTGKSHFLHGLGNALAGRGIGPIACLASPAFAAEVRALADADALAEWRRRSGWVGAFLLDDLHLLTGDRRTQQELAALVAELLEGRRQMAFASLRALDDLDLEPRLLSQLKGGLILELPPPDHEVRLALVKRLLAGTAAARDAALTDYLAGRPADSIRAVQGMVQRVLRAAEAQQVTPSPALAREVLEVVTQGRGGGSGPRRSEVGRASGVLPPGIGLVRSGEKTVKHWPSVTDRLIAELR